MISLRNRPTLVLINGRRAATSPVAASGGYAFTDVSMIPVSAIERVEVLADGASATYGADAVGGVVNIILKSKLRGCRVRRPLWSGQGRRLHSAKLLRHAGHG